MGLQPDEEDQRWRGTWFDWNMWGPGGKAQLDSLELPDAYFNRIAVLRDLVDTFDREIVFLDRDIHLILCDDAGYNAVQAI